MMRLIVSNFRPIVTCLFWSLVLYVLGIALNNLTSLGQHDYAEFCLRLNNWTDRIEPIFNLRSDRFLLPVLVYGPNNQVSGLRESIIMAIKDTLNRTLVAPPFYKHSRNDFSADAKHVLGTESRIDLNNLRKLIPIIPSHQANEACRNTIDAFYATRSTFCSKEKVTKLDRIEAACNYWHIDCGEKDDFIIRKQNHQTHQCPPAKIPIYPSKEIFSSEMTTSHGPLFINNLDRVGQVQMHAFYDTYHRCPILGFPYRMTNFHNLLEGSIKSVSNEELNLVRQVFEYTKRPKNVQLAVKKFLRLVINNEYLALHWRYNKNDWTVHCSALSVTESEKFMCDKINQVIDSPLEIGSALAKYLYGFDFSFIYIAAPPDINEIITAVKHNIETALPKVKVLLANDLVPFLDNLFASCDYYENERFEILSLAEMEICSRSSLFLRSTGSSWSMNINLERMIDGTNVLDGLNTDLFEV